MPAKEGRIVDKRIGGQDRESYIELKDVLKVDLDGNIIGKEKHKRLIDAFIEDCKVGGSSSRLGDSQLWSCRSLRRERRPGTLSSRPMKQPLFSKQMQTESMETSFKHTPGCP